jgi:hypothetical protein
LQSVRVNVKEPFVVWFDIHLIEARKAKQAGVAAFVMKPFAKSAPSFITRTVLEGDFARLYSSEDSCLRRL